MAGESVKRKLSDAATTDHKREVELGCWPRFFADIQNDIDAIAQQYTQQTKDFNNMQKFGSCMLLLFIPFAAITVGAGVGVAAGGPVGGIAGGAVGLVLGVSFLYLLLKYVWYGEDGANDTANTVTQSDEAGTVGSHSYESFDSKESEEQLKQKTQAATQALQSKADPQALLSGNTYH